MRYENHFYFGRWSDLSYTTKTKRSALGHRYVEWVHDHPRPASEPRSLLTPSPLVTTENM